MIEEGMPNLAVRLSVSQKKKIKKNILYDKQKGKCLYCGNGVTIHQLTFDHVIRRKDGGTGYISNLVLACTFCNQYRELENASEEACMKFLKRHIHYIHTRRI